MNLRYATFDGLQSTVSAHFSGDYCRKVTEMLIGLKLINNQRTVRNSKGLTISIEILLQKWRKSNESRFAIIFEMNDSHCTRSLPTMVLSPWNRCLYQISVEDWLNNWYLTLCHWYRHYSETVMINIDGSSNFPSNTRKDVNNSTFVWAAFNRTVGIVFTISPHPHSLTLALHSSNPHLIIHKPEKYVDSLSSPA